MITSIVGVARIGDIKYFSIDISLLVKPDFFRDIFQEHIKRQPLDISFESGRYCISGKSAVKPPRHRFELVVGEKLSFDSSRRANEEHQLAGTGELTPRESACLSIIQLPSYITSGEQHR